MEGENRRDHNKTSEGEAGERYETMGMGPLPAPSGNTGTPTLRGTLNTHGEARQAEHTWETQAEHIWSGRKDRRKGEEEKVKKGTRFLHSLLDVYSAPGSLVDENEPGKVGGCGEKNGVRF